MAESNTQEAPSKDKKKRKSNLKKSDMPPSEELSSAPESRKASLAPPTRHEDGHKTSLAPPTEPEHQPQRTGSLTSLAPPTRPEDGHKTSLAPPTEPEHQPQRTGSLTSLTPPTRPEDGHKASLALPTEPEHQPQRTGSLKQGDGPRRRLSARTAASVLEDLDEDKLLELKEAFKLFDLDQDGIISSIDLKQTFGTLGKTDVTDEEIKQMLSEAAHPLDFDAFVMLLGFKTISLDPEEILLEALGKWDKDNSGFIQEEMIRHDLMTWGDRFTEKEVDVALEDAPTFVEKGKHMIDYIRFCKMLCGLRKKTRDITMEDFLQ